MTVETYQCDHPYYNSCTLFKSKEKGLAVIQQRFNKNTKTTWWTGIDYFWTKEIEQNVYFKKVFDEMAGDCKDGIYPTIELRKLLWKLKLKPEKREEWETRF